MIVGKMQLLEVKMSFDSRPFLWLWGGSTTPYTTTVPAGNRCSEFVMIDFNSQFLDASNDIVYI